MTLKEQTEFIYGLFQEYRDKNEAAGGKNDIFLAQAKAFRDVYESLVVLDNVRRQMAGVEYE